MKLIDVDELAMALMAHGVNKAWFSHETDLAQQRLIAEWLREEIDAELITETKPGRKAAP